ncbi:MAG: hypothetical protein MUE33_00605 [Cytophagaceae bacterium]|jgi:hypothetical protein|nr:hypothetical protein [Cytophagaceae bacterium]
MKQLLLFFATLFCTSIGFHIQVYAGDQHKDKTTTTFSQQEIKRKGIYLSEIFDQEVKARRDIHIKYSDAMRFVDTEEIKDNVPASTAKPFNMPIAEIQKNVQRAHSALHTVTENEMYTTLLEGKNITLPIGIKKQVGNKSIVICLDSIIFTPTYAYGVVYVVVEDTKNDKTLAFMGRDIRFTKAGGFTGDARLELLEEYTLNFGSTADVTFLVDETHENYVVFDCDGFKRLHVDARVFLSENKFKRSFVGIPAPGADMRVTVDFQADFVSLDNFMVQLSNVPAFEIVGLEGTVFSVRTIAFDYSSLVNPTGIQFPTNYDHPALLSGSPEAWEGFYIDGLNILLPEEIKVKNNPGRITLYVNNAFIDKLGFTGTIGADNLFTLDNGDMSGWKYSLDNISIKLVKSSLTEAQFSGRLVVPITKSDQEFRYQAIIQPANQYSFTVALQNNMSFPLWGAGKVDIYQDSWIQVAVVNKKFKPNASLSGRMTIGAAINGAEGQSEDSNEDNKASLANINFIKLRISTDAPYIFLDPNGGAFGIGTSGAKQKLARLPVNISEITLQSGVNPNRLGLKVTVNVNLSGNSDPSKGFGGSCTFTIWAKVNAPAKPEYSFYKLELNRIELKNIKIAILTLNGFIEFYRDDVVYGSGFSGRIAVDIEIGAGTVKGDLRAIFGKKTSTTDPDGIYRYWAVDALVGFPAVPIFPGIVYLNAIGGGASNRMAIQRTAPVAGAKFVSNSGATYTPDESKGLAVKLLLGIQGQSSKIYDGQLIFEVAFNSNGGLSQIVFSGFVQIGSLSKTNPLDKVKGSMGGFIDKINSKADGAMPAKATSSEVYGEIQRMGDGGAVLAQWMMVYDRDNKSFTCNLDVFVDVFGIIKGVNPNGHAGRIDILFTQREWHVFVGVPSYPVGISVIDFVNITAYFMVGHNLYPPLKMPFPGAPNPTFPAGTDGTVRLGKGFGLGARLNISISGGGSFYYKAGVDAGFDILIWNVEGQYCGGKPKGMKGWFGTGQVFLYTYGSAGLNTEVRVPYPCNWGWGCCFRIFRKRICPCPTFSWCHLVTRMHISATIDVGIYGYVEAPNPTYVEGGIRILGFDIKVKGGKRC